MKTYDDFGWVQMFHKGTLEKLTVPVLNLFFGTMKKAEKVNTIKAWLANSKYQSQSQLYLGRVAQSALGWYQKGPCVN